MLLISRVGKNHIYIYGLYTVFLAGKATNIRSYTVYIDGSGQPYLFPCVLLQLLRRASTEGRTMALHSSKQALCPDTGMFCNFLQEMTF